VTSSLIEELQDVATQLEQAAEKGQHGSVTEPLEALETEAGRFARAWSGSNLGFHASIYYNEFDPPPPGAHFDPEWGFRGQFQGTTGDWREYSHADVVALIRAGAGEPDLAAAMSARSEAEATATQAKADVVSILTTYLGQHNDALVEQLLGDTERHRTIALDDVKRAALPTGQLMSRDSTALMQGPRVAPHQEVLAEVIWIRHAFTACDSLAALAQRAANHLRRLASSDQNSEAPVPGQRVFIGHGGSSLWREFKEFISDRLKLPWDEFNRVPAAGLTNTDRLASMLDSAGIAFLLMTAEEAMADGAEQARQNVVHEVGLFQGRLGPERAIVLLEEGCQEFTNIQGLVQIRFPRGTISAAFEEVRRVLEREGFLSA
jgi:predicted nucleotide-binding protein